MRQRKPLRKVFEGWCKVPLDQERRGSRSDRCRQRAISKAVGGNSECGTSVRGISTGCNGRGMTYDFSDPCANCKATGVGRSQDLTTASEPFVGQGLEMTACDQAETTQMSVENNNRDSRSYREGYQQSYFPQSPFPQSPPAGPLDNGFLPGLPPSTPSADIEQSIPAASLTFVEYNCSFPATSQFTLDGMPWNWTMSDQIATQQLPSVLPLDSLFITTPSLGDSSTRAFVNPAGSASEDLGDQSRPQGLQYGTQLQDINATPVPGTWHGTNDTHGSDMAFVPRPEAGHGFLMLPEDPYGNSFIAFELYENQPDLRTPSIDTLQSHKSTQAFEEVFNQSYVSSPSAVGHPSLFSFLPDFRVSDPENL